MALRNISSMGSKQDRPLIPLLQFPVTELEDGQTVDGLSLYRALSRQHTGDPNNYLDTMNAVLDHYLRVWVNQIHPSHEAVRVYEDNVFEQVDTFFNALACPDAVLLKEWPDVMEYIADVLNIQLHVWRRGPDEPEGESSYRHVSSYGKASLPVYHVQQSQHRGVQGSDGLSLTMTHFDSLVQDESGKQLITFLRAKKRDMDLERRYDAVPRLYNGLEMKQICWWWQTAANTDDFDNRQDGAYDEVWHAT